jgi:hypothetical protein
VIGIDFGSRDMAPEQIKNLKDKFKKQIFWNHRPLTIKTLERQKVY